MLLERFLAGVRRDVLPNGLTLLTRHEPVGVVAIVTWVKAGYFHEPDQVAGMAHLFEHMFFKGSKNFPGAEEIAQHVSLLGGSTNAGTIYDSTSYYFVLPREGFVRGVEIQADAIRNPLFDPEELRKEAEVVIEESNRKLDNPPALAVERMFATAFTAHRMRRWRIGSNEVLRNIRRDDLLAFFETLYRPENIIVAIAGDVAHQEALDVASRTFGAIERGELRKQYGPSEPPQQGFRFSESSGDIKQSYSVFGWHTPGINSEDDQSLDALAAIAGGGRYSRLYREVVNEGAASSVSASNSTFEDVGMFTVRLSGNDEKLEEAEARTIAAIERLRRQGPSQFELDLARNGIESSFLFELEGVLGQAQTLAFYESRGSYLDVGRHLEALEGITPADVRAAAVEHLREENLTLYRYRREGTPPSSTEAALIALRKAGTAARQAEPSEESIPFAVAPVAEPQLEQPLRRFVLPNGIALFVKERPGTPTVSAGVYFRGGKQHESAANAGITQLMTRVMRRGTASRSAEQIDREIEFLGTQIGAVVDEDFFGFSIDVASRFFPAAVAITADVIRNPSFPGEEIVRSRQLQLAAIERALDSTSERAFQLFFEAFYHGHPYSQPDAGYASSVSALDSTDLEKWYREQVVADTAVAVVVGNVVADEVHEMMSRELGSLPASREIRSAVPPFVPPAVPIEKVESRDRRQTAIVIGFPTVPPDHPDWILLRLLQDITSGLAGTFFSELRGKRSLAYTVFAGEYSHQLAGAFVAFIATEASKEGEAREGLMREIGRLSRDGITSSDLERAKSHLAGTTKIRLQTNGALRGEIASNYLYNLGLDFTGRFLERVHGATEDELRDLAARYLSGTGYAVGILRGAG